MINLLSSATSLPEHRFTTPELLAELAHKLSPEVVSTIKNLGVDERCSTLANYPAFLSGEPMRPTGSATGLGVEAARQSIERWGGDPRRIGLLIAATNTPAQLLPCLASEISAKLHGTLSRSISTVSMQAQGCSVLLKSIEVARWYLCSNPDKVALVLMSEAHTPYITPLLQKQYSGYRELAQQRKRLGLGDDEITARRLDTTLVVQSMLFGDGAVALLLGREDGIASFGPIAHLTNDSPEDVNLLTMEGGSLRPAVNGKPQYFMQPKVPVRGAHYAVKTVRDVLAHPASPVSDISQIDNCMIHTGSRKILDGVCAQLSLAPDSPSVRSSYETLRRYGNLSSASTGFMLAEGGARKGYALVVGFGVGFTASAGVMNFG